MVIFKGGWGVVGGCGFVVVVVDDDFLGMGVDLLVAGPIR